MVVKPINPPLVSVARKIPPTLIVIHSTAGSNLSGAVDTLRERNLGYNYIIDKDGVVYKCCPAGNYTYHAGNSYGPREEAQRVSKQQDDGGNFVAGCSVNSYSVGISFVHENDGRQVTDAQKVAVRELIKALKDQFPSIEWLTGHRLVSPGRKSDPNDFQIGPVAAELDLKLFVP